MSGIETDESSRWGANRRTPSVVFGSAKNPQRPAEIHPEGAL